VTIGATRPARPPRVAIVGSGPSGFYAAGQLLSHKGRAIEVDIYDRLPTPWGLVRGGVAPDHPKIKSVSRVYEKIARMPGFRFHGSVEVGRDLSHEELSAWYDAVLYAVGTATDRRSGIPGEDLAGSWSATEFVGWYNGHPDFSDLQFDLSGRRAIVIGNGNVAVDVARMLSLTEDELRGTDIAEHALEALVGAKVEEIFVLGRRGPEQAAFTNPELRELGVMGDADVIVDPGDLQIPDELREEPLDATARRNVELLHEYARTPRAGRAKRIVLRFLTSPVEILGDGRVERLRVVRNALRDENGRLRASATDREELIDCSLVFRAIGYTGLPLTGLPFDERRGVIPNENGRVTGLAATYVAGWIKRGPSGVIGTNKKCASDTVKSLLADIESGGLGAGDVPGPDEVDRRLRERRPDLVDYPGWERIDRAEKAAGELQNRPRVKFTRTAELLEASGVRAVARDPAG